MIFTTERTLSEGKDFLFKCQFYDPRDIFRGNYLQLNIETLSAKYERGIPEIDNIIDKIIENPNGKHYNWETISLDKEIYVVFERNENNEVSSVQFQNKRPSSSNYLTQYSVFYAKKTNEIIFKDYIFEKYFLNEKDAPNAEKILADLTDIDKVHLQVSIKDGSYAVKDLLINGVPLRDKLRSFENNKE